MEEQVGSGVQEGGAGGGGRVILMSVGASNLPDDDAHYASSVVERGSVRGSRSKTELAHVSLLEGLARPWPCDDAGWEVMIIKTEHGAR